MFSRFPSTLLASAALLAAAAAPAIASAQAASEQVRIRGTIVRVDAKTLVVQDRGGEVVSLARPADMQLSEVYQIKLADIKKGSFIGTAAMPQADGSQKALEVVVFPEAARGTGEGHRPWDLLPQSTMTNATVADLAVAPSTVPGGQKLTLRYKDGEKTVIVPPSAPVVSFKPGKADENV